jgi:hypothetical protein
MKPALFHFHCRQWFIALREASLASISHHTFGKIGKCRSTIGAAWGHHGRDLPEPYDKGRRREPGGLSR